MSQALQLKSLRIQTPSGQCRKYNSSVRKCGFIFMLENLGCGTVRTCAKVVVREDKLKVDLVSVFCGA